MANSTVARIGNFIKIDALPLLGSGKLDLAALNKMVEAFVSESENIK